MQKIRYSTRSQYLLAFETWLSTKGSAIKSGDTVSTFVEPQTGFVGQDAQLEVISDDHECFKSDWPYGKETFPSRLKVLATAIRNCGLYGRYQSSHHAGKMELRKIEPPPHDSPEARRWRG